MGDDAPAALPPLARGRVVQWAAEVLTDLDPAVLPGPVRRVASFVPSRRARLGGTHLQAALEASDAFRTAVVVPARERHADVFAVLDAGGEAADPVDLAAAAWLARPDGWTDVVRRSAERLASGGDAEAAAKAAATVERLERELAAARERGRVDVERARGEVAAVREELAEQRRRARTAASDAGRALAEARTAQAEAEARAAAAEQRAADAEARLRRTERRAAEAEDALEAARRGAREARALDDARLRLLLDVVVDGAAGLRRELALPPVSVLPADVASLPSERPVGDGPRQRGLEAGDPSRLDELLALPQVHLLVDGYNVTKRGYGEATLVQQRARLTAGLAALQAATQAEVTVVWDGAERSGRVPERAPRTVRVLFSDADVSADSVLRRLVAAEPEGRPLVVVSDDREVVDVVRRDGARTVSSGLLLRRLERLRA